MVKVSSIYQYWSMTDLPLLIPAFLVKCGWTHLESQDEGVWLGVEVAFTGQQVKAEETIVTPTLSDFKIRSELPHNVFARISARLVNHFHSVLVPESWHHSKINEDIHSKFKLVSTEAEGFSYTVVPPFSEHLFRQKIKILNWRWF